MVPVSEVVSLPNESTSDTRFISHCIQLSVLLCVRSVRVFSVSQQFSLTSHLSALAAFAGRQEVMCLWSIGGFTASRILQIHCELRIHSVNVITQIF